MVFPLMVTSPKKMDLFNLIPDTIQNAIEAADLSVILLNAKSVGGEKAINFAAYLGWSESTNLT